jgi:hypothetical protein
MSDKEIIGYKLSGMRGDVAEITQYVAPSSVRYAKKLLLEEGYEKVTEEAFEELPEGVGFDIE